MDSANEETRLKEHCYLLLQGSRWWKAQNEETRLKEHCYLLLQGSRLWKAQMKKLG